MNFKDTTKELETLYFNTYKTMTDAISQEIERLCEITKVKFIAGNGTFLLETGINHNQVSIEDIIEDDFDWSYCWIEEDLEDCSEDYQKKVLDKLQLIHFHWKPFLKSVEDLSDSIGQEYLLSHCYNCTKYYEEI